MKKNYDEITLQILLITEDTVRCSQGGSGGDDYVTDEFN